MIKNIIAIGAISLLLGGCACNKTVDSPNKNIKLSVNINNGIASYSVSMGNQTILESSPLGIVTSTQEFTQGLKIKSKSSVEKIEKSYTLKAGKCSDATYTANEQRYTLENAKGENCEVIFRVSDNGVAFAYRLEGSGEVEVLSENSGFKLPATSTAFISPMAKAKTGWARTNPSYEDQYQRDMVHGTASAYGQGWVFPALFKIADNKAWILLSETGVDGSYVGSHLAEECSEGLYMVEFAHPDNNLPEDPVSPTVTLPYTTPWRVAIIAPELNGIVGSTLAQDLVEPKYESKHDYQPGRTAWSWLTLKDENTVYGVQRQFIDMAAKLGYEYTLIDGFWDTQIGRDKIVELVQYAESKGVKIVLWYNSNGNWNDANQTPRDRMNSDTARLSEMQWLQKIGVKGIKVDFFGGDKQVEMRRYEAILKDANEHGIYVNFHGATLPRGWDIMYPNFATAEAVMGMEFVTFSQETADQQPAHCTTLPFTRNVVAPMDFTPLMLTPRLGPAPETGPERRTSAAFELALPIVLYSAVQNFGLIPESLASYPDFVASYLSAVPTVWDETQLLAGYPGRDVVMARRSGKRWFLAAINGENVPKTISVTLPETFAGLSTAIRDAATWNTVESEQTTVHAGKQIDIELQPYAGYIMYTN